MKTLLALLFALVLGACAAGGATSTTSPAPTTSLAPTTSSSSRVTTTTVPQSTTTTVTYPVRPGVVVETVVAALDSGTGGLSVDADGNLYSADFGEPGRRGTKVYRVTPSGEVEVFVNDPNIFTASGNVFGPDGLLYQSSFRSGQVYRIDAEGNATPFQARFSGPVGLAITDDLHIYVAECTLGRIAVLNPDGTRDTFATDDRFECPNGLTFDPDGNLYMADFGSGDVFKITSDAVVTLLATLPGDNNGHLKYFNGELIVAARGANQIYAVGLDGSIELIAGSGELGLEDGPGTDAAIGLPNAIAIGSDGAIYLNHANNDGNSNSPTALRVIRISG